MKKSSWNYEIIANIDRKDFEMIDRCTIFAAVLYTIINHDDSHTKILRRDAPMEAGQRRCVSPTDQRRASCGKIRIGARLDKMESDLPVIFAGWTKSRMRGRYSGARRTILRISPQRPNCRRRRWLIPAAVPVGQWGMRPIVV